MTGNAVKSIYLTEAAQKEGRKRIMEKDLKDKKPAENGTPKVPWPKLIPAAAVIAALVFSGIKAQGSDANTESVQKADTTVMSASELEKYLGYEETSDSADSSTAAKKSSTSKKSTSKKSTKKTAAKKSSGKRTVSESARNNASAAGQGSTQTPVADVPANGYKDGTYEGSGTGFGGTIRVRVTVSGGKIAAIDILDASGETASYFASAQSAEQPILPTELSRQSRMHYPRQRQMEAASRSPLHLWQPPHQRQQKPLQRNQSQPQIQILTARKSIWMVHTKHPQKVTAEM